MDRELVSKRKICSGTIYVTKPDKFRLGVNNSGARQERAFFSKICLEIYIYNGFLRIDIKIFATIRKTPA